MKLKPFLFALLTSACVAMGTSSSAQIVANSLPSGESLPAVWNPAPPLLPTPEKWSANVSWAITNPAPNVYTYWYRVEHMGPGPLSPINTPGQPIKSVSLDMDPHGVVFENAGTFEFSQFELSPPNAPGQSFGAEPVFNDAAKLTWSHYFGIYNGIRDYEVIYLWYRTPYPACTEAIISVQDGSVGQTYVPVPCIQLASLGNYVWEDLNVDGIQDANEPGIDGVQVDLYTKDGTFVATKTTTNGGYYLFENLVPGEYYVKFTTPAGYEITVQDTPSDDEKDSDIDANGETIDILLEAGDNDLTWDAGYFKRVSISGYLFCDKNGNSTKDGGEDAIEGVQVELDGDADLAVLTDADGKFSFTGLLPGDYIISSPANIGTKTLVTPSPLNVSLKSGESSDNNNFGYNCVVIIPASISGVVYCDKNGNNTKDADEDPIDGVQVDLSGPVNMSVITDADGTYEFENLLPGNYVVSVPATVGDKTLTTTSPLNVALVSGQDSTGNNFGYDCAEAEPGSISGYLYCDSNKNCKKDSGEDGIPGVEVKLSGDATGSVITDSDGYYIFDGLEAGNYTITVPGTVGTKYLHTSNNLKVTLAAGQEVENKNFGYKCPTIVPGKISGYLYCDANRNCKFDLGEEPLKGVMVTLSGAANQSVLTNSDGKYEFTNLNPGSYTISVPANVAGSILSTQSPLQVWLSSGQVVTSKNFGYKCVTVCKPLRTQTMGGWGAKPSGGNPGTILKDNFSKVFPNGVKIGGSKKLTFTSASAVEKYLPAGGKCIALKCSLVNPTSSQGVLSGQVLALQINVAMSDAGVFQQGLGDAVVKYGPFAGKTVRQVLDIANAVLGGANPPKCISICDICCVVTKINENYVDGKTDKGYLYNPLCPKPPQYCK